MLSEIFYTFVVTSIVGLIIALARMAYKTKCKKVSFCCLEIIRDTAIEESEYRMNRSIEDDVNSDIKNSV